MAYILIDPKVLEDKGIRLFEKIPDGRAVVETNLLKVLGSVKNIELVATTQELNEMVSLQRKSLADKENVQVVSDAVGEDTASVDFADTAVE